VSILRRSQLLEFRSSDLCGGRNAKRTLENVKAGDLELSSEDLVEISRLLEKYPRKGGRLVDATDEQLCLWN
jgi:aryl-alcohol dehydrogenase-like predicted oxidoreductase